MVQNPDNIKNLIFDLGGVILQIDLVRGIEAMRRLQVVDFEAQPLHFDGNDTLLDFEKGLITEREFLEKIKGRSRIELRDEDVISAWNEMLVGFPGESIDLILTLKKIPKVRTFLLSNTNIIHHKTYTRELQEVYNLKDLNDLFEMSYLSHELHMRKPDPEIFHYVLQDGEMNAEETLFIDDHLPNIETARNLGINAIHLADGITVNDLFRGQLKAIWM